MSVEAALMRLNTDYWYEVDHEAGRHAHDFFVADEPVYRIQDRVFAGRAAIQAFYAWRAGRGPRVARHCIVNARVVPEADDLARMTSILLLFAADGAPVLPAAPPIQIADVEDVCRLVDGVWRYQSRRLTTLFAGGAPITLPNP